MEKRHNRVCPVERAGGLDNVFRRWLQNPKKILHPYVKEGMIVLDVGCGPGFFSIDMAKMVGESGRVIAADLQEEMLKKLGNKIQGSALEKRIILHCCKEEEIGISDTVDFVLAFYMFHEVPSQEDFIRQLASLLRPNGKLFIAEPPFHVSNSAFKKLLDMAKNVGLEVVERPKVFLSKAVILKKAA